MALDQLLDTPQAAAIAKSLGTSFGVSPDQAQAAVAIVSQALTDRIERNTLSSGGIADLVDLLARPAAGAALTKSGAVTSPDVAAAGNGILEVLLGSKHASRGLAARAARQTGVDESTLKKMLPVVASLLVGALQSRAMPQIEKSVSALPAVGSPLPLPGEAPLPRGGTSSAPQRPLPIPGDDIPGLDGPSRFPQLPDIIRRSGRQVQVPAPGQGGASPLDEVIRQILANVLGFRNGGVLAFILKVLFSRWFMGLIGRILRGALGSR